MGNKVNHRRLAEGRSPSRSNNSFEGEKRSALVSSMYQDTRPATFRDRRNRRPNDARTIRRMMED